MDQLSKDACAATKSGLTYGKYMARKKMLAPATKSAPSTVKKCLLCGKELPAGKGNRRYCNAECAEKYRHQRAQKR